MANPIIIKNHLKVGDLDAETDTSLLETCFIDKGYVNQLMDVNDPLSIVLGRTGAGKSALIYKISQLAEKSKQIDPNDISIRFLEYSDIIQFLDALDVNLDLFYRLLWRHILIVELLKLRYNIKNETDNRNFFDSISDYFSRDTVKKKAIEYFREWGDRFWLDTDEHLKVITQKLENDTKANLGSKYKGLSFSVCGAEKLTDEQKTEIKQRANQVVSSLQIKKLNEMLDLIAEHSFNDPQQNFYIVIDQLDESWANTITRCKFIRALIEEIKIFRKIENIKIIAAMRKDLLDLVFDKTRGAGFQEEKYESYILPIQWTREELTDLVELRVKEVFKRQYTNEDVIFKDIFPSATRGGGQLAIDFIMERTLFRPRDILQFVNECFKIAYGRERISWRTIYAAEAQYSEKRLKSLKEEWGEVYPSFDETVEILRGLQSSFKRSDLSESRLEHIITDLYDQNSEDPCVLAVKDYFDNTGEVKQIEILNKILICLYRVGAIGIKISSLSTFMWSFLDQSTVTRGEVRRASQIKIHKMLYRSLDIHVTGSERFETIETEDYI
ncbi:TPA: P-loop ATPase, Sll1717 family [Photobacterium damselae]